MAPQEEEVAEVLEREKINSVPAVKNKSIRGEVLEEEWETRLGCLERSTLRCLSFYECFGCKLCWIFSPATVTTTHEDFEHLLKMAHGESSLPLASLAYSGISTPLPPSQGKWLIDSRATDHMTSTAYLFVTYSPFQQPLLVILADGSQVPAYGKGSNLSALIYVSKMCFMCPHSL